MHYHIIIAPYRFDTTDYNQNAPLLLWVLLHPTFWHRGQVEGYLGMSLAPCIASILK